MAATARNEWKSLKRALDNAGVPEREFESVAVVALGQILRRRSGEEPTRLFTDEEARILGEGGLDLSPRRGDEPDVVVRSAAGFAVMLVQAKTAGEVAHDLGVTSARIRQRASERTLYGIRDGDEWRFPGWQFDDSGRPIRGLAAVFPVMSGDLHPIAVFRFLSEPSTDLEIDDEPVSPLTWLATGGNPESVAAIAATL
jgi:hypothetical protein